MTITPNKLVPKAVHLKRWAQPKLVPQAVGQQVSAGLYASVARYRRKLLFRKCGQVVDIPDSAAVDTGDYYAAYFIGHTGAYAKYLAFRLGLARPNFPNSGDDPVPVDPRVRISTFGSISSDVDYDIRVGLGAGGTSQDVPSEWSWPLQLVPVAPDEDFAVAIRLIAGARLIACTCYELSDDDLSAYDLDKVDAAVDGPIFDAQREVIAIGAGTMYRKNAAHVINVSVSDENSPFTRISSPYANIFDGTILNSVTANTPGWNLQTLYHNSVSRTAVPAVMWVYAKTSAGTGGKVRLKDSNGNVSLEITGIGTTLQWYSVTGTIPAAFLKQDVQIASDGTNTLSVYAVSVYEHE